MYVLESVWKTLTADIFARNLLLLILSILAGTLAIFIMKKVKKSRNLPPGPLGLPIFGYLPFLGKVAYKTLYELSATYGPVFSLYLGPRFVVVLNNIESVQEALSNPDVMDRPKDPPNHLLPDSLSMAVTNGNVWKEQRNFAVKILRKFGMGKEAIEERIQDEIIRLEEKIDAYNGQAMNLTEILTPSISNIMLSMLIAKEDPTGRRRALIDSLLKIMPFYFRPTRIHAFFPWLRRWMIAFKIWGYDKMNEIMKTSSEFLQSEIEQHENSSIDDSASDYIYEYLQARKKGKSTFTDGMLRGNMLSMLGAGTTPPRTTVEWCLVSMTLYPEVQRRVYEEVSGELGKERPKWEDRHRTPYTLAVIMEVMRHYAIIPISMLRTNSQPCLIGGYNIPKGTIVMTNIWAVHHDPKHWEEPNKFRPERFIKNGTVQKPVAFIPFSYGKRNCPGEDLSWVEVYLYFVSLIQRYQIVAGKDTNGFTNLLGIANMVIVHNFCFVRRSEYSN